MTNRFCFRCFKPDFVSEIEFPTREAVREIVREKLASVSQVLEEAVKSHIPKIITGSCTVEEVRRFLRLLQATLRLINLTKTIY